jgi:streptogramin lyase
VPRIGDLEIVRPGGGVEVVAPTGVIRGPDDRVWFTSLGNDRLGRVDPASSRIEVFAIPPAPFACRPTSTPVPTGAFGSRASDAIASAASIPLLRRCCR